MKRQITACEIVAQALQETGEDITVEEVERIWEIWGPMIENMQHDPEFKKIFDAMRVKK